MARRLVNAIYVLTRLSKVSGDFRLCSQVQAAAVSIMSNIAEGFERTHLQEKIQFYNVARGSAGEVRSLLYVVSDNFVEATGEAERLRDDVSRRSAFVLHVKPDRIGEYVEAHAAVWPEMLAALHAAGIPAGACSASRRGRERPGARGSGGAVEIQH